MFRNTAERYGLVTKLLHWGIAALMLALIWLGWYMVDLTYYDTWYNKSLAYHKSFGIIVLGLSVVFVSWKLYSPSPDALPTIPRWQRAAATIMHYCLIAMLLLLPVTGYIISTSAGKPVAVFDWVTVPAWLPKNDSLRDFAIELHFYLAYGTGFLVLGHAGAAIKHQFLDKDGTLARMLWRRP
jgi:cytochrome b561